MGKRIGVAVIHGAGIQEEAFAEILIEKIKLQLSQPGHDATEYIFMPIYWGSVFNQRERELWESVQKGGELDFRSLRKFIIEFLGDAIAYQPTSDQFQNYEKVHDVYFKALKRLSSEAGEDAPLIIIGHSLGTVITSNFFYDLQKKVNPLPYIEEWKRNASPLMKGDTLATFISLGSPLALWSLRYHDFNKPIQIPATFFARKHPNHNGGWWNIYDRDDVLGFPLKSLNDAYDHAVKEDIEMNIGNLFTSWNPLSHFQYVKDERVIELIVKRFMELSRSLD